MWLANHGNYDVFGIGDGFVTEEFVVRASVDGRSEWDNKDGANYQVANFHNVVVGNVVLGKAAAELGLQGGGDFVVQTSWLEGEIYVDNLCYVKRVGLWYTAGGGATRPVLHAFLTENESDKALAEAIIVMAHQLDLQPPRGWRRKSSTSCRPRSAVTTPQGFPYSPAVPEEAFVRLLE